MTELQKKIHNAILANDAELLALCRKETCLDVDAKMCNWSYDGRSFHTIMCHTLCLCMADAKKAEEENLTISKKVQDFYIDILNEYMQKYDLQTFHSVKDIRVGDAVSVRNNKKYVEVQGQFSTYNVFEINGSELVCSLKSYVSDEIGCREVIKINPKNFVIGMHPSPIYKVGNINKFYFITF